MMTKVSHITILVKDQNEALAFYKDKLGLKIHTDAMFGEMRWLTLCTQGDPHFEIALLVAGDKDQGLVGKQGGSYPLFNFETKDCKGDYKTLRAAGVEFVGEPRVESWGTGVTFKDLYGNLIYLNQNA